MKKNIILSMLVLMSLPNIASAQPPAKDPYSVGPPVREGVVGSAVVGGILGCLGATTVSALALALVRRPIDSALKFCPYGAAGGAIFLVGANLSHSAPLTQEQLDALNSGNDVPVDSAAALPPEESRAAATVPLEE